MAPFRTALNADEDIPFLIRVFACLQKIKNAVVALIGQQLHFFIYTFLRTIPIAAALPTESISSIPHSHTLSPVFGDVTVVGT